MIGIILEFVFIGFILGIIFAIIGVNYQLGLILAGGYLVLKKSI